MSNDNSRVKFERHQSGLSSGTASGHSLSHNGVACSGHGGPGEAVTSNQARAKHDHSMDYSSMPTHSHGGSPCQGHEQPLEQNHHSPARHSHQENSHKRHSHQGNSHQRHSHSENSQSEHSHGGVPCGGHGGPAGHQQAQDMEYNRTIEVRFSPSYLFYSRCI